MSLDTIDRRESNIRGYVRSFPVVFDTAHGAWIHDTQGKAYLDFFAGAGTLNYGHNDPLVTSAIIEYIQHGGVMHGLDTATVAKTQFIEAFEEIILKPRCLDYKIQFTGPTGTNAVEAAIKLARKQKQRSHVVAFTNAYHGHSLGSLALTGNQYYHDIAYGSHNNVSHLPFDGYCGEQDTSLLLQKMLSDESSGLPLPAAIILETVQGEGGINVASNQWLQRIANICKQHDILLIADDIQVGNGRTGTFFSFESAGITPDLVCLSKAIGGGLPMSLVLMRPEVDIWKPGQHTGTFRGNNLAFVAARQLLTYWQDPTFVHRIASKSRIVMERLMNWQQEFAGFIAQIRGKGMIWGIDTGADPWASLACKNAFAEGLMIETSGARDHVIKLLPPITISDTELVDGLDRLELAIRKAIQGRTATLPIRSPSFTTITTPSPFVSPT